MSHIFTYLIGIVSGMFLLANTKAIHMPVVINSLSLNQQALGVAAIAITVGLTIRAIARKKGAQRTGGKAKQ